MLASVSTVNKLYTSQLKMALKLMLVVCMLAIAGLMMVSMVEAECRWTGCHAHSAGDWCNVLGPGYHVNKWERCNGLLGKQEYCCN